MKAIYRKHDVLCFCRVCHTDNYVESHGTDAYCRKCKVYTEHENIPYDLRDFSGCWWTGKRTYAPAHQRQA